MTLVYCGSLASVHSHRPANPSRVSASCSTLLHMLSFWLESASTVLRACCQLFDCSCRSDHVVVDWSCWKPNCLSGLLNGFALQPAFLFITCDPDTGKHYHDLSLVSVVAGRVSAESQAPLEVSGQRLPLEALLSSSTLLWASPSECAGARLFVALFVRLLGRLSQRQSSSDRCQKVLGSFVNL